MNYKEGYGIVRRVDELGRIVLPKELRKNKGIACKSVVILDLEEINGKEVITIKQFDPSCIFCGALKNIATFKGQNICVSCFEEFKKNQ